MTKPADYHLPASISFGRLPTSAAPPARCLRGLAPVRAGPGPFLPEAAMALVLAVALLIVEADMPRRKSPAPKPDQATDALLQTLNPHAAGIDVGSAEHWVCVP